jgi:hypothetical protein
MGDWPEVSLVPVYGHGDLGLRATALRPVGCTTWTIFVNAHDSDLWLCVIEAADLKPLHFDAESAAFFAKASLLFGEEWDDCFRNLDGVLWYQRTLLDHMTASMRRRIEGSSVRDIAEWRSAMHDVGSGEFLRARLTGEDPLSLRN